DSASSGRAQFISLSPLRGERVRGMSGALLAAAQPIVAKCLESWQGLAILYTIGGALSPHDVIRMADRKPSTSMHRRQASSKCSIPSGESLQSSNERRVVCWSLIEEEIG